jgi:glycolate oxidase
MEVKMAFSRDAYRELEDVVGEENISSDLAVLDAYTFTGTYGLKSIEARYQAHRPEAVILPGSAKDVQAVIKLCNRRGIMSKASSTSFGAHNTAGSEGVVLLDMRRMNRILDIDEKNMFILLEPYVSFAQVQAEAMKRGLNCNIIGAGSQTSFFASYTSMDGNNSQAISQGYSGRNLLGVEWVMPTGDIMRVGAAGSDAGWFSGDGPGPSLRGIIRGYKGACGGLGVFTKCAGHLHPWPGGPQMNVTGISPYYETEVPPLFEYHIVEFENWETCVDAIYKIGEHKIAYAIHKAGGPGTHGTIVTGSNDEYWAKRQAGKYLIPRISICVVLAANSPGEHEFQVKVLNRILEDTGGEICPVGEEPEFRNRDFLHMIRTCFTPRLAFRAGGSFHVDGIVGTESMDNVAICLKIDDQLRDRYAAKGLIMDDDTSNAWGAPMEDSNYGLAECGHPISSTDQASIKGMRQMMVEGHALAITTPISVSWRALGTGSYGISTAEIAPHCFNYDRWMRKIKKALDPNTASDPSTYALPE